MGKVILYSKAVRIVVIVKKVKSKGNILKNYEAQILLNILKLIGYKIKLYFLFSFYLF